MARHVFPLACLLFLACPAAAQEPAAQSSEVREYYDKAFSFYMSGDYSKAIENWNMVLRLDPKQITAKNMIEEARQKMAGSSANLKSEFYALVGRGRYADAQVKIESMLASDPTNPAYQTLQNRLRRITGVVSRRGPASRAWNAGAEGIAAWINEKEDLAFAYDALRYAQELAPADRAFPRLVALLEEDAPQLKLNDTKPANSGILDHKKDLALHHIYDSKFYLAAKELEGVLRLEPQDVVALKRLGSVYLQMKDYRRARKSWQQAAALSPEDEQLKEYLEALDKAAPSAETPEPQKPARKAPHKKIRR